MTRCVEGKERPHENARGGWLAGSVSCEWLYKPQTGVYFHTPSGTLWKKLASRKQGMALMVISGFADEKAGVGLSGRALALLQKTIIAWRGETCKFEDMERDLQGGICEEGRMSQLRSSARGREDGHEASATGRRSFDTTSRLRSFLSPWLSPSEEELAPRDGAKSPAQLQRALTSASLLHHNSRQPSPPEMSFRKQSSMPSRAASDWGTTQLQSIAAVHREREDSWRHHAKRHSSSRVIDESCRLAVGAKVLFHKGHRGVLLTACVDKDEYTVEAEGEIVRDAQGVPIVFRADELSLLSTVTEFD